MDLQAGMLQDRPLFGSNWNNSAKCGSRGSNWNNSPLNLNANIGARGVADTGLTPRLNIPALPEGKIHNGGLSRLVVSRTSGGALL